MTPTFLETVSSYLTNLFSSEPAPKLIEPKIGYVYFIIEAANLHVNRNEEILVKIGFAIDPIRRIRSLQTGNPSSLTIYKSIKSEKYKQLENFLHKKYKSKKVRGEWFNISLSEIDCICNAHEFVTEFCHTNN